VNFYILAALLEYTKTGI